MPLPKGASNAVIEAGRKFVAAHGATRLGEVAKLHFRTAQVVTGAAGATGGVADGEAME